MSEPDNNRIQKLFLAGLELPVDERDAWLAEQCGDDANLLREVRALLAHDSPDDDPLEKGLDEALEDIPTTLIPDSTTGGEPSEGEMTQIDGELFLSKLSEVGVLSPEEIEALNQTVASGQSSANPRQLASQLVSQGKLTEYQASALLKGQPELLIDKYLILDLLDAGGMGMVFKAIHRPMNRTVAIKMIAQHLLASPEQVKRFQREVRVAATLEHPNIVRSYDADRARGVHFLVMEYVRGDNLATIVRRQGPMSVEQAVDCIRQAAKGLRYAQKQGVIHRDIKPGNLMLGDEGLVKVLDLGLANVDASFRLAQQSSLTGDQDNATAQSLVGSELTTAGAVLGTVSFMAPEQSLDAHKADTRADIYSLGCTLYYLLIGEAPYKGDTIFQVFMEHREGSIPTLRDKRPDVPEKVEAVCEKMLAKAPEDRYQTMGELLSGIEDCDITPPPEKAARSVSEGRANSPVRPTDTLASQESTSQPRSRGALTWLSVLVLLLAFGGGYWWWHSNAVQGNAQYDESSADNGNVTAAMQPAAIAEPQCGLRFNGEGDFVEIPLIDHLGDDPLTIEAWVHLEANESAGIVFQGSYGRYSLYHTPADAKLKPHHWIFGHEFNSGCLNAISHEKVEFGRRYHIAAVWQKHRPRLYIDGVLASADRDGYWTSRPSIRNAYIGGWPQTEDFIRSAFRGLIDELRISDVARYSEDFTPQDRFETDDDTLALYHFDEGEGDVLHDASGNDHHGTIVGAKWVRIDEQSKLAQVSRALSFNIGMVTLPQFDWNETTTFTWELRVSQDDDRWGEILKLKHESLNIYLARSPNQQWVATIKKGDDASVLAQVRAAIPFIARESYQIAVVFDESELLLFVNGHLASRAKLLSEFKMPNRPILIGSNLEEQAFNGTIDEIRFSNIARYTEDYTPVERFEPDEHTIALYHCDEEGDTLIDSSGSGYHVNLTEATTGNVSRIKIYDEANMSAADLLATGEYEWRVVERLPEPINSAAGELGAHLTADGLTIVFASQRQQGSFGAHDLWTCSRTSVDNRWSAPINLGEQINSDKHETAPVLSPDGLSLYFQRVGDGSFVSTRDSFESPWSQAAPYESGSFGTPWSTSDGLAMVYSSMKGTGNRDLCIKRRPSRSAPWPDATRLESPINSDVDESHPTLSDDGRLLIFDRGTETNDPQVGKLWMATRTDWDAPWSEPVSIDSLNSGTLDRTPRLLADGKSFLFDSWRDAKHGDIYLARLVRKDSSTATIEPSAVDLLAKVNIELDITTTDQSSNWDWKLSGQGLEGSLDPTAIARSSGMKCCIDAVEDGFVPARTEAFATNALFEGSVLLENVQRKSSEGGRHFGGRTAANAAGVLCKNNIQNVMLATLDGPVIPQQLVEPPDTGRQTADEERHVVALFEFALFVVGGAVSIQHANRTDRRPAREDLVSLRHADDVAGPLLGATV